MQLQWHRVSEDEWRGDMPTLYFVAVRAGDRWDVSLHDVNMAGLQITVVPFESLDAVFSGALLWAKSLIMIWGHELDKISGQSSELS